MTRSDGRAKDQLRPIKFERNWLENAEGSCLVHFGRTRVLCVASVTAGVPRFKKDSGRVGSRQNMPCYPDQPNQGQIVNLLKENWAAEPKKFQDLWAEA